MQWPTLQQLSERLTLPDGVSLRFFREPEIEGLTELFLAWYPQVRVGGESVFLRADFLRHHVVREGFLIPDIFAFLIEIDGEVGGFMSFERQGASATLHARLGMLAPQHRLGFLGALGFVVFEQLGRLCQAELLLSWVTLSSKAQQLFAERRGFRLVGLVPGFDRDQISPSRSARICEALYAKLLIPLTEVVFPEAGSLSPSAQKMLALVTPR